MSIEIPDWVVSKVLDELFPGNSGYVIPNYQDPMKAALSAALEGWLQEVGYTNAEEMRELLAGRGGWVSGLELDGDTETLYTLRKDKTP